jgi:hypothetical protein
MVVDIHRFIWRFRSLSVCDQSSACSTALSAVLTEMICLVNSGWESALDNIAIRIDTRDQHAVLTPFTGPDRRALFTPDRVAIEANTGQVIDERFDPRTSFEGAMFRWPGMRFS